MPIENFKLLSSVKTNYLFIDNMKFWHNGNRNVRLIEIDFNIDFYNSDLFSKFSIYFPNEIKNAVDKRQAEFIAGRIAAREALLLAGFIQSDGEALPNVHIGKHRSPQWPQGFVGSISHNQNKAMCVIGEIKNIKSIGIDIENILSDKVINEINGQIYTTEEYELLISNGLNPNIASTLIFSAKESLFKALYSAVNNYFGFECARLINIRSASNSLVFKLKSDFYRENGLNQIYTVHYNFDDTVVKTLAII
jgi:enterobactin synthetase component D